MRYVTAIAVASILALAVSLAGSRPEPTEQYIAQNGKVIPGSPLNRIVPSLDLDHIPLADSIRLLSQRTSVPIRVKLSAFQACDIELRAPLKLHLKNEALSAALDTMFLTAARNGKLIYWTDGNGVVISTKSDPEGAAVVTRIFNVADILKGIVGRPRFFQSGGPTFELPSASDGPPTLSEAKYALVHLFQDSVDSDSWKEYGGNVGSARIWGDWMLVTQTVRNQSAMEALLEQLAETAPINGTALK